MHFFLLFKDKFNTFQVIGLPHERLGEEVCACLRLSHKDIKLTLKDLREYCKEKISHFKIPSVLYIRTSFPTTASGKIQKFKLKDEIVLLHTQFK